MTDVVGSTAQWEKDPAAMSQAMARHDQISAQIIEACHGLLVKPRGEGDSLFCAFRVTTRALEAAIQLVQAFESEPWPPNTQIKVRAAIHLGDVELRSNDYYGPTVNRCARLRSIALENQILVSGAAFEVIAGAAPAGCQLLDLGLHRLKDLLRPERVYLLHQGAERPPVTSLRSLNTVPNNLPIRLTSFIGRTQEIESISRELDHSRLVTLTGPGGTGKSSIALQVAAQKIDEYPGGGWFVDLSSEEVAGRVSQAICTIFNRAPQPHEDEISAIASLLGTERCLLILDNCDQVVNEVALCLKPLLQRVPGLNVLTTSREPIRISGEQLFPVHTLPVITNSEAVSLEELQLDSFQLFCDRAISRKPNFKLDPSVASDIAAICKALDGIPLAIEQVASHLSTLTTRQIRDRVSDRLKLARTKDRGIAKRHETLRAMIDWSYETLSPHAQELFRRLSIFPSGWSLEAVEKICTDETLAADEIIDLMEILVDKSLVATTETAHGQTRFHFLETIKQYAYELEPSASEELGAQFVAWHTEVALEADEHLAGSEQTYWMELLDSETENLHRALQLCGENEPQKLLLLASALRRYWYRRGQMAEALRWLDAHGSDWPRRHRARDAGSARKLDYLARHRGVRDGRHPGGYGDRRNRGEQTRDGENPGPAVYERRRPAGGRGTHYEQHGRGFGLCDPARCERCSRG